MESTTRISDRIRDDSGMNSTSPMVRELTIVISLATVFGVEWFLFRWAAALAGKRGYSRGHGCWAIVFGPFAILVLALLPKRSSAPRVPPPLPSRAEHLTDELERLAALRDQRILTDS